MLVAFQFENKSSKSIFVKFYSNPDASYIMHPRVCKTSEGTKKNGEQLKNGDIELSGKLRSPRVNHPRSMDQFQPDLCCRDLLEKSVSPSCTIGKLLFLKSQSANAF